MWCKFRIFPLFLLALFFVLPLNAQDTADFTRDPRALAQRFLGFSEADLALAPITPLYDIGDTAEFWVGKTGSDQPARITATLGGMAANVYLWVEQGIIYDPQALERVAATTQQIQAIVRQRDSQGLPFIPGLENAILPNSLSAIPDVDTDPHLFIVYTSDLGNTQYTYNINDSLPEVLAPGGYTNQHELIALNTSLLPGAPLDDPAYNGIITRALYDLVFAYNAPHQASWLRDALGWYNLLQLQQVALPESFIRTYFQSPGISLRSLTFSGANAGALGGQQLFLNYLRQRFGDTLIRALFTSPGTGMTAIDRWLAQNNYTDPITSERITTADVFADFLAANVINAPIGDGRYVHTRSTLPTDQGPAGQVIRENLNFAAPRQLVGQYGTANFYVGSSQGGDFTLIFDGQPITPRLPLGERDPDDRFYWSGHHANHHATLTRAFDLRAVARATLEFDTWYDLADGWNYVYVTASADNGATWDIVPIHQLALSNRMGLAYGVGMTGLSNLDGPLPFPYLGVQFANDGMTVTDVVTGTPAAAAGFQVGDIIIGYNEAEWPGAPDIIGLLANYRPGDTLSFYIQRGIQRISLPTILGAHPERVILPQPEWLTHRADLSAYGGARILLRFEYISMPGQENPGFALDNIAITELNYHDDAENPTGWAMTGWQQVDNRVRQNFLLQVLSSGTESDPPRIWQLITPRDEATRGEWAFTIRPTEVLVFMVAGLNDDTDEFASFSLALTAADEGA